MSSIIIPPLGWKPFEERTDDENLIHATIVNQMPAFGMPAQGKPAVGFKLLLTDLWKHPKVVEALGFAFPGWHQITGSCLPADAPVRMASGEEKPISSVVVGDYVISHTGSQRKVIGTRSRRTSENMRRIRLRGWADRIYCTDAHMVATWSGRTIEWKKAEDIEVGDLLIASSGDKTEMSGVIDALDYVAGGCDVSKLEGYTYKNGRDVSATHRRTSALRKAVAGLNLDCPMVTVNHGRRKAMIPRYIAITPSFARLIGLFLAEGNVHKDRTSFTLSATEECLAEEICTLIRGIFRIESEIVRSPKKPNTLIVRTSSAAFSRFMSALCPGKALTKRVPKVFFGMKKDIQRALIGGWFDGDGYVGQRSRGDRATGVSSSKGMIRDFAMLCLSAGVVCSTTTRKAHKQSKESGSLDMWPHFARSIECNKTALLPEKKSHLKTSASMTPFGRALPVVSNEQIGVPEDPVYDLEIESDNSFIAYGIAIHNCVGVGGGNATQTLIMVDALIRNELEKIILAAWPYNYGRSRQLGGMNGQGEGSMGSTYAKSLALDGVSDWIASLGLPQVTQGDQLLIGQQAEMQWSDGRKGSPELRTEAGQHKVISAPLSSGAEVRDAIINGYPVTRAFSTFVNPNSASVRNGVLIGHYNGRGGHQESWLGYWNHPQNGELIFEMNQWGKAVYGKDPGGGADGGVWLSIDEVDRQCQSGEIYALSQYDGYPAQPDVPKLVNWGDIWS